MSDFDYKKGYYRLFLFARISSLILAVALMITGQIYIHRGEVIECLKENPTFTVEQCENKVLNR